MGKADKYVVWVILWELLVWGVFFGYGMLATVSAAAFTPLSTPFSAVFDLTTFAAYAPPAALAVAVLWRKNRSWARTGIAAFAALVPLLLPGLAPWDYFREAGRMRRAPTREIIRTVEFPESLYIQDDLRFAKHERATMERHYVVSMSPEHTFAVSRYLDGSHLKALALNDDENIIHLYRTDDAPFFADSKTCWQEYAELRQELKARAEERRRTGRRYGDDPELDRRVGRLRDRVVSKEYDCRRIDDDKLKAAPTFERADMLPPLRYRAHIRREDKTWLCGLLTAYRIRQIDVYDNQSGERIAWARNIRRPGGWFGAYHNLGPFGEYEMEDGPGERHFRAFLEEVFPGLSGEKREQAE